MANSSQTLGEAARRGRLVTATCRACAHAASFLATDLARVANPAEPIARIGFKCRECHKRDVEVSASDLDQDRRPGIVVWRPMRL